jgi:hypothetical protein
MSAITLEHQNKTDNKNSVPLKNSTLPTGRNILWGKSQQASTTATTNNKLSYRKILSLNPPDLWLIKIPTQEENGRN